MEEQKPNVTADEETQSDEQINNDDVKDSDVSDDSQSDTANADEPSDSKSQEDEEKEKEKAKNAHFAELRRKKEAEEKAKREAQEKAKEQKIRDEATLKAKLEVIKTNPFTEEPIVDEEDLKVYEIQKQLEDEGKDPIQDLPKRLAELRRTEAKKRAEDEAEETKRSEKIHNEIVELQKKYPNLNTLELANDPVFQECLNGRAGRWTQVEIYEFYLDKKAKAEAKAKEEKQKQVIEKNGARMSTPPSSKANGSVTAKKVSDMTDEEFTKYWKEHY